MAGSRALKLSVSIWYRPEDGHIHMKIAGKTKERMTTISDNQEAKRGHPHLFCHLRDELKSAGMWERTIPTN